jgi:hypothetical protein
MGDFGAILRLLGQSGKVTMKTTHTITAIFASPVFAIIASGIPRKSRLIESGDAIGMPTTRSGKKMYICGCVGLVLRGFEAN